jgi:hypothetical protein
MSLESESIMLCKPNRGRVAATTTGWWRARTGNIAAAQAEEMEVFYERYSNLT